VSRRGSRGEGRQVAHSAGGVIYRLGGCGVFVALIATSGGTRWGLPKGHVSDDETPEDAARREIAEETGLYGVVLQPLETIEYWFRAGRGRIHKFVDLFLLRYEHGEVVPQEAEVDDARWFALDDAIASATFPREQAVLERVREMWLRGELT
jgi:8-oxo-dGTP pyrophosphatase MutT (NUDIX family)